VAYSTGRLVQLVRQRIEERPAVRLTDLATDCGVSPRTIRRVLRQELASTYRELRAQILVARVDALQNACRAMSAKEMARQLGFACPGSFSRTLKRLSASSAATGQVWQNRAGALGPVSDDHD
jgi:AraC-like DNA-binding protein